MNYINTKRKYKFLWQGERADERVPRSGGPAILVTNFGYCPNSLSLLILFLGSVCLTQLCCKRATLALFCLGLFSFVFDLSQAQYHKFIAPWLSHLIERITTANLFLYLSLLVICKISLSIRVIQHSVSILRYRAIYVLSIFAHFSSIHLYSHLVRYLCTEIPHTIS